MKLGSQKRKVKPRDEAGTTEKEVHECTPSVAPRAGEVGSI